MWRNDCQRTSTLRDAVVFAELRRTRCEDSQSAVRLDVQHAADGRRTLRCSTNAAR